MKPAGRLPLNLVYSIGDSGPTRIVQMMILGEPRPTLWQGQLCSLMLLNGKKMFKVDRTFGLIRNPLAK